MTKSTKKVKARVLLVTWLGLAAILSACGGGSVSGNGTNAPEADNHGFNVLASTTLEVRATPEAVTLFGASSVELVVANPGDSAQTLAFELTWPAGAVSSNALSFSNPCETGLLSFGKTSTKVTLSIPAKQSCRWALTKSFDSAAAGQAVTAVSLTNVKLLSDLPSFDVIDPRSKYVGIWNSQCRTTGESASEIELVQLTLDGRNRLAFTTTEHTYASSDCSGQYSVTDTYSGFQEFLGTKTIDGWGEVDKTRELEADGQPDGYLAIATVRDDKLYMSQGDGVDITVDANGYPTAIDTAGFLTRVSY